MRFIIEVWVITNSQCHAENLISVNYIFHKSHMSGSGLFLLFHFYLFIIYLFIFVCLFMHLILHKSKFDSLSPPFLSFSLSESIELWSPRRRKISTPSRRYQFQVVVLSTQFTVLKWKYSLTIRAVKTFLPKKYCSSTMQSSGDMIASLFFLFTYLLWFEALIEVLFCFLLIVWSPVFVGLVEFPAFFNRWTIWEFYILVNSDR